MAILGPPIRKDGATLGPPLSAATPKKGLFDRFGGAEPRDFTPTPKTGLSFRMTNGGSFSNPFFDPPPREMPQEETFQGNTPGVILRSAARDAGALAINSIGALSKISADTIAGLSLGVVNPNQGTLNVPLSNKVLYKYSPSLAESNAQLGVDPSITSNGPLGFVGGGLALAAPFGAFSNIERGVSSGITAMESLLRTKALSTTGDTAKTVIINPRIAKLIPKVVDLARPTISGALYNSAYATGDEQSKQGLLDKAWRGALLFGAFHLGTSAARVAGKTFVHYLKFKKIGIPFTGQDIADMVEGKKLVPPEVKSVIENMTLAEKRRFAARAVRNLEGEVLVAKTRVRRSDVPKKAGTNDIDAKAPTTPDEIINDVPRGKKAASSPTQEGVTVDAVSTPVEREPVSPSTGPQNLDSMAERPLAPPSAPKTLDEVVTDEATAIRNEFKAKKRAELNKRNAITADIFREKYKALKRSEAAAVEAASQAGLTADGPFQGPFQPPVQGPGLTQGPFISRSAPRETIKTTIESLSPRAVTPPSDLVSHGGGINSNGPPSIPTEATLGAAIEPEDAPVSAPVITNNASGESDASVEALNFVKSEEAKGAAYSTFNIKTRKVEPQALGLNLRDPVLDPHKVLLRTVDSKTTIVAAGSKSQNFKLTGASKAIFERNLAKEQPTSEAPAPPAPTTEVPGALAQAKVKGLGDIDTRINTIALSKVFKTHIDAGVKLNKLKTLKIVADAFGIPFSALRSNINFSQKAIEEAFELALVNKGREIVTSDRPESVKFELLKKIYDNQPILAQRTSGSIANQQYSTPLPMAYLMGKAIDIGKGKVYEPTAGNGVLVIGARQGLTVVNELDVGFRTEHLMDTFNNVHNEDALGLVEKRPSLFKKQFDAVIMNPPFGGAEAKEYDGFTINKLEHRIVAESLAAMKDGGKASFIIGGRNFDSKGNTTTTDRVFFNYLYSHFNVTHNVDVEGNLYNKQGTKVPIRIVTIDGRKTTPDNAIGPYEPSQVESASTFNELRDVLFASSKAEPIISTRRIDEQPTGERRPAVPIVGSGGGISKGSGGSVKAEAAVAAGESSGTPGRGTGTDSGPSIIEAGGSSERHTFGSGESAAPGISNKLNEKSGTTGGTSITGAVPVNDSVGGVGPQRPGETVNEFQSKYTPTSKGKSGDFLTPKNLEGQTKTALSVLKKEVGEIHEYVKKKLEYKTEKELFDSLFAEQIDTVALAIFNIEKGQAVIIGDATGVGKGRTAAAIIRYANKRGKKPIFITAKPKLFSDMYGDLLDIGHKINPFVMHGNSDADIVDSKGQILVKKGGSPAAYKKFKADAQGFMEDFDAIFTAYSQLQRPNSQREILREFSVDNIIVLDESHTASGDSSTGQFIASHMLSEAEGVVYLSATYAKRPDTLPLYYRTSLGDIGIPLPDLVTAIKAGGVPLQQVIAQALSAQGQYVRKELDFSGVSIETIIDGKNETRDIERADGITALLRQIVQFDIEKKAVVSDLNAKAKKEGKVIAGKTSTSAGVKSTSFASNVHNLIGQLLLGLKADATVKEALKVLRTGKKPLVNLSNTMGSFLDFYMETTGAKIGDAIDLTFKDVLRKAAEGTLRYLETDAGGKKIVKKFIPEQDFTPAIFTIWRGLLRDIDAFQTEVPTSPIDFIKAGIQKEGFSVGEITGRKLFIDYMQTPPVIAQRTKVELDRNKTVNGFNDGSIDSLIFNSAGSTGLSAHASEKFKDQRVRHMIVTQADLNIDTFIQSLGRIFRTGQVVKPAYTILQTALPAEIRPAVVLAGKMASLNANTSANAESANTMKNVPDMLNPEGDKVVAAYLKENSELDDMLGNPLVSGAPAKGLAVKEAVSLNSDEDEETINAMKKVTGRVAIMPVALQKTFFSDVEALYHRHIAYLNEIGENTLVTKDFDFQARTLKHTKIFDGADPSSPFTSDAFLETVSVKMLKKPFNKTKIESLLKGELKGKTAEAYTNDKIAEIRKAASEFVKRRNIEIPKLPEGAQKMAMIRLNEIEPQFRYIEETLKEFVIGSMVKVQVSEEYAKEGVVLKVDHFYSKSSNPVAPSMISITFAMADATQTLSLFLSRKMNILASQPLSPQRFEEWNSLTPSELNENRNIITGNLLAGFERFGRKAEIVNYTTAEGGLKTGILLPRSLSSDDLGILFSHRIGGVNDAIGFLNENKLGAIKLGVTDKNVLIIQQHERLRVEVPKTTKAGGKYFLNERILQSVKNHEFVSRSGKMVASVASADISSFLGAMNAETGIKFEIPIPESEKGMTLDFMGFSAIYDASAGLLRRTFPRAAENITIPLNKEQQIGFLKTYLSSPKLISGKARFYVIAGKNAGHKQDRLRVHAEKRLNKIFKHINSKKLHDEFSSLQWMGDAEAVEYGQTDLLEMGVTPVVATAYLKHRKFHNSVWRLLSIHRKAYGGKTGYIEGHVPHVFENWNVYEVKSEVAEKDSGGNVIVNRTLAGIVGSFRSLRQATAYANELDPKKNYVIRPKAFTLPDYLMGKTVLKDASFFRLVGKLEKGLELTREEAMGLTNEVSRRKNRRRFFGSLLKRTGQTGFSKGDIHKVLSRYYNSSIRYMVLDDFKAAVVPKFERDFGVEHGRSGNALRDKTLAIYIERYINDVGGVPTHIEDMLNESIKRLPLIGSFVGSDRPAVWTVNSLLHATAVLKLGLFNLSSGLVNLTQLVNTFTKVPSTHFAWATAKAVRPWALLDLRSKNLLKRIGVPFDLGLANTGGFSITNAGGSIVRGSLFFFNGAEQLNRRVTALAAYRWAIKDLGMSVKQATLFARGIVDETQFDYSVADTAQVFRNPVGRLLGQFKPFAIKELEFILNLKGVENIKFWIPILLLSGFLGMPLAKELSSLIEYITGRNPILELKSFLFTWSGSDPQKKKAVEVALYGVGATLGMDISQRVGPGSILPERAKDLLGPTINTIAGAIGIIKKEQGLTQLVKDFSPSIGNFLTGVKTALNEGRVEDPFHRGRLKYVATSGDIAVKSAGFRPLRESVLSDTESIRRYKNRRFSKIQQKFIDRGVAAIKRGDAQGLVTALSRAAKYGVLITDSQLQAEMLNKALPQNVRSLLLTKKALRGEQLGVAEFAGLGLVPQ